MLTNGSILSRQGISGSPGMTPVFDMGTEEFLQQLFDPDADAYILAVIAAGASVSAGQSLALNRFVKFGKTEGWFDSVKRFYLPIWGVAAANSIDLITRGSGTFVGGVTHSSGHVVFNGTTGAFRDNATIVNHGVTTSSVHAMALIYDNPATSPEFARYWGAFDSLDGTTELTTFLRPTYISSRAFGPGAGIISSAITPSLQEGVLMQNKLSTAVAGHRVTLLKTEGVAISSKSTQINAQLTAAAKMSWGARNSQVDTLNAFCAYSCGAMSVGVSIGQDDLQNTYLRRVKDLWETCTGLTLP